MTLKVIKIKDFNDCFQITSTYKHTARRLKTIKNDKEESKRCASSRACSKIKDLRLANYFDYFVTLTIASDIKFKWLDAINLFNNAIKNYKRNAENRGLEFKYLYVFELTEKEGIHLHGFFSGFYDLYVNDFNHLSSKYFDKIGFQCFNDANVVNPFYFIKYILKEDKIENKHKYYFSNNLKMPLVDTLHDNLNEFSNFVWTFENNYCKMITIAK